MELLTSLIITIVGEIVKKLSARFGKQKAKKIVLSTVLLSSIAYTLLTGYGVLTEEMITTTLHVALTAVGIYEILVKRLVYPVFKG